MQRIDENTYIDETLITCLEYQLFIDEMFWRGKSHQPDHWTSTQFPLGLARNPIVGVRRSDAELFCHWMTKREVDGAYYRLPNDVEVNDFPIKPNLYTLPLGYWTKGVNSRFHFLGKNLSNTNPREIDPILFVQKASDLAVNLDRSARRNQYRELDSDLKRALDRAFELNLDQLKDHDDQLDVALLYVLDRRQALENHHNRELAIENAMTYTLSKALRLISSQSPINTIEIAFDAYTDLYTLQERIHRHSPPVEGIRLVKEWAK